MGDAQVGVQARLMSQALRKLTPSTSQSGGRALKFYSSVRIDLRRGEPIKQGDQSVGGRVKAKVSKNKVAPPFRKAEFDIMFGEGISREADILELGVAKGIISKSGAYFSFGETRLGQGRENAKDYLRQNSELAQEIESQIKGGSPEVTPEQ